MREAPVLHRGLALTLALCAAPATAQDFDVDVELVFATDGSGSIDDEELRLQREGYARALADPRVQQAIRGGATGRIAVAFVEWGGADSQHVIVDWTVIDGPDSAAAFGQALLAAPRRAVGWNSISNALDLSKRLIEGNSHQGLRKVIDVSADAGQRGGRPLPEVRAEALAAGITINGLAVLSRGGRPGWGGALEDFFRDQVIGGPGAFVITADADARFTEAVVRKLILEIAERPPETAAMPPG
ncbi:DUF1194 domain-containing protein [Inquilinus limosus]|uniref:DUF1194 domain-containing protein n=1 Tax=Inquilinus limosus TaxID=171674 RepID=UPI003F171F4D